MADPRHNPADFRTSRELSDRVEHDFHKRKDPFRRWIRWLSVAACAAVVAWIGFAAATGDRTIYEAGPVAPPHRFFENNCAMCHTTWAPATRFRVVSGNFEPVTSVNDEACQSCHKGSEHYEKQEEPHKPFGCADCHREHRYDPTLTAAADARCVECHGADQGERAAERDRRWPVTTITSFSADHPNFDALAEGDPAGLVFRFNHSVHLRHEYEEERGEDGKLVRKLVKGIQGPKGELVDLSQNCAECHQLDSERRHMLPISYESHCEKCHPLYFDNVNFPEGKAPHGADLTTLRGFLIEKYTERALQNAALVAPQQPVRPLPGRAPDASPLTEEGRRQVREDAAAADERLIAPIAETEEAAREAALRRELALFGPEALGGCRLCHEVEPGKESDEPDRRGFPAEWAVVPPEILSQWMSRSRFSHDAHRFVDCTACHRDASYHPPRTPADSTDTADVLMPSIAACRTCHSDAAGPLMVAETRLSGPPVASRCIDCHPYHRREGEPLSGSIFFDLPETSPAGNDGS
jgi:hypothetical protein